MRNPYTATRPADVANAAARERIAELEAENARLRERVAELEGWERARISRRWQKP